MKRFGEQGNPSCKICEELIVVFQRRCETGNVVFAFNMNLNLLIKLIRYNWYADRGPPFPFQTAADWKTSDKNNLGSDEPQ